jgi:hypothetical protein
VQVDDGAIDEAVIVLSLHCVLEKKQQERQRGWEKAEISQGGGYSAGVWRGTEVKQAATTAARCSKQRQRAVAYAVSF